MALDDINITTTYNVVTTNFGSGGDINFGK
jgi:hypothetical protein